MDKNEQRTETTCHSDLSQRRNCRYYSAKTGRCTMVTREAVWQEKGPAKSAARDQK